MVCSRCKSSSFSFNCLWGMLVYSLFGLKQAGQLSHTCDSCYLLDSFSTCFKLFNESFICYLWENPYLCDNSIVSSDVTFFTHLTLLMCRLVWSYTLDQKVVSPILGVVELKKDYWFNKALLLEAFATIFSVFFTCLQKFCCVLTYPLSSLCNFSRQKSYMCCNASMEMIDSRFHSHLSFFFSF